MPCRPDRLEGSHGVGCGGVPTVGSIEAESEADRREWMGCARRRGRRGRLNVAFSSQPCRLPQSQLALAGRPADRVLSWQTLSAFLPDWRHGPPSGIRGHRSSSAGDLYPTATVAATPAVIKAHVQSTAPAAPAAAHPNHSFPYSLQIQPSIEPTSTPTCNQPPCDFSLSGRHWHNRYLCKVLAPCFTSYCPWSRTFPWTD